MSDVEIVLTHEPISGDCEEAEREIRGLREQLAAANARAERAEAALDKLKRAWSVFQSDPPTMRCVGGYPTMRVTVSLDGWARLITAMDMMGAVLAGERGEAEA